MRTAEEPPTSLELTAANLAGRCAAALASRHTMGGSNVASSPHGSFKSLTAVNPLRPRMSSADES